MAKVLSRPELKAFAASGIAADVAQEAADEIVQKLAKCTKELTVRVVRFRPTTKTRGRDALSQEILTTVTVDVGDDESHGFVPSRVLQAIVTYQESIDGQRFLNASIMKD